MQVMMAWMSLLSSCLWSWEHRLSSKSVKMDAAFLEGLSPQSKYSIVNMPNPSKVSSFNGSDILKEAKKASKYCSEPGAEAKGKAALTFMS
jgi:hypothetical protein